MQCLNCKKQIPYAAPICNHCLCRTNFNIDGGMLFPPYDMYNQPVYELFADQQKNAAREKTINSMYYNSEIERLKGNKQKLQAKHIYSFLFVIFSMMIFPALIMPFFMFLIEIIFCKGLLTIGIPVLIWIILLFSSVFVFWKTVFKSHGKRKKIDTKIRNYKIHKNKDRYYYNNSVFGFVVFDKTEIGDSTITYFYEVDKRLIKDIKYDTENSEYILELSENVYTDYNFFATNKFIVPDVFDDTQLSIALGLDLPAKYMEF